MPTTILMNDNRLVQSTTNTNDESIVLLACRLNNYLVLAYARMICIHSFISYSTTPTFNYTSSIIPMLVVRSSMCYRRCYRVDYSWNQINRRYCTVLYWTVQKLSVVVRIQYSTVQYVRRLIGSITLVWKTIERVNNKGIACFSCFILLLFSRTATNIWIWIELQ